MIDLVAALVYLAAIALAAGLLYFFGSIHWEYHVLGIALAAWCAFIVVPEHIASVQADLTLGALIVFLLMWGAGGLVFHPHAHHLSLHLPHRHHRV